MSDEDDLKFMETWKEIVDRVCNEQDLQRVSKLAQKLIEAIDAQTKHAHPKPKGSKAA